VDDFDAAHAALLDAAVKVEGEPGEWNGHRWLYFRNADGYLFEIKVSPPLCHSGTDSHSDRSTFNEQMRGR
jgi:hypothetical protein